MVPVPPAGDMVVVVSVWVCGARVGEATVVVLFMPAAGVGDVVVVVDVVGATSVRCSQAASSAAQARMMMDFFIGLVGLMSWD